MLANSIALIGYRNELLAGGLPEDLVNEMVREAGVELIRETQCLIITQETADEIATNRDGTKSDG